MNLSGHPNMTDPTATSQTWGQLPRRGQQQQQATELRYEDYHPTGVLVAANSSTVPRGHDGQQQQQHDSSETTYHLNIPLAEDDGSFIQARIDDLGTTLDQQQRSLRTILALVRVIIVILSLLLVITAADLSIWFIKTRLF